MTSVVIEIMDEANDKEDDSQRGRGHLQQGHLQQGHLKRVQNQRAISQTKNELVG